MSANNEEDHVRQALQQRLLEVEEKLARLGDHVTTLTDEQLESLFIRGGEPLDIDGTLIDIGPRFFEPAIPPDGLAEFRQAVESHWCFTNQWDGTTENDTWKPNCHYLNGKDKFGYEEFFEKHPGKFPPCWDPVGCAQDREQWILEVLLSCRVHRDNILGTGVEHLWEDIETSSFDGWVDGYLPGFARLGPDPYKYQYWSKHAFANMKEEQPWKPHVAATVYERKVPEEGEVLRSEIATAMALLRWQFHRKDFRKHHTLPSLVFSFHHDKYCRITQFHFDGQRVILRPSRRLNLATDEPTDEAYHILRWLMTNPLGDTALREQPKEEEEEKELDWNLDHDPASFPLKVQG